MDAAIILLGMSMHALSADSAELAQGYDSARALVLKHCPLQFEAGALQEPWDKLVKACTARDAEKAIRMNKSAKSATSIESACRAALSRGFWASGKGVMELVRPQKPAELNKSEPKQPAKPSMQATLMCAVCDKARNGKGTVPDRWKGKLPYKQALLINSNY